VTPRPDASVRVSQGSDIFAKAALQKSWPVCTPAAAFVRSPPFPFLFFGSARKYFPGLRSVAAAVVKRKNTDNALVKNHDLAGSASCSETTFLSSIICC
jgi:hypothetical protein